MDTRSTLRIAVAALVTFALVGCADDGAAGSPLNARSAAVETGVTASYVPGATVEFIATEFAFAPNGLVAEPGDYHGVLVNDGTMVHDIKFSNGEAIQAGVGERVEFDFTVPEQGVTFLCSIPGHAEAGMTGTIDTPASAAAARAGAAGQGAGPAMDVVEANPDAAPYVLHDPQVPARGQGNGVTLVAGGAPDGGDLIEVEMVVEEKLMTVAEGFEQMVWTFNGTVPGPVIRTEIDLLPGRSSDDGYRWTLSKGSSVFPIREGLTLKAHAYVEWRTPVSYLLPVLRDLTGTYRTPQLDLQQDQPSRRQEGTLP